MSNEKEERKELEKRDIVWCNDHINDWLGYYEVVYAYGNETDSPVDLALEYEPNYGDVVSIITVPLWKCHLVVKYADRLDKDEIS